MSKPTTVDEYLAVQPEALREVGEKARDLIDSVLPDVPSALWHAHPVWSMGGAPGRKPVVFLKAYASYVTFGFWRGQAIEDASGRLTAGSREMATVKLTTPADLDPELFTDWLRQAHALDATA